jgi:hypothetical protein
MHGPTEKWRTICLRTQGRKFVPELWVNLFSISKALKNSFNLGNEDVVMKLMKGNTTLYFNRMLKTKNRFALGIKLLPILGNNIATIAVEADKVKPMIKINNLHKMLGYCGEVATRMTGKSFGYDVIGDYMTCEACSVAKARQKNINKDWKGNSITEDATLDEAEIRKQNKALIISKLKSWFNPDPSKFLETQNSGRESSKQRILHLIW